MVEMSRENDLLSRFFDECFCDFKITLQHSLVMGSQREQHPSGDGKLTAVDANLPSMGKGLALPGLSLEGPVAVMIISWQHPGCCTGHRSRSGES